MATALRAALAAALCLAAAADAGAWERERALAEVGALRAALEPLLAAEALGPRRPGPKRPGRAAPSGAALRQLDGLVADLQRRLAAGYGREHARPFARRALLLLPDLEALARHPGLAPELRAGVAAAAEQLRALGALYGQGRGW